MAGSYSHIVDKDNNFLGTELLDHLGDAYEALEECHAIIRILTGGDKEKVFLAVQKVVAEYNKEYAEQMTCEKYWKDADFEMDEL